MPAKPSTLPEWATGGGAVVTEPTTPEKQAGWLAGAGNKPRASWMNWWKKNVYQWVQYLNDPAAMLADFALAGLHVSYFMCTTNGSGGHTFTAERNITIHIGGGAIGDFGWTYTEPYLARPAMLSMGPRKSSGYYVAFDEPYGNPEAKGKIGFRDNTGANISCATTALTFAMIAIGVKDPNPP